jgi:predicted NBD/HSP70 family sugar kinase
LSRSTIGNVIRSLEEQGIVEEGEHTGARHGLTGRPAVAVALVPGSGATVGVAINRERLKIGVADLRGTVLAEHDEALVPGSDGETILILVADRVRAMISGLGVPPGRVIGLAIGIPGPVDEDGSVDTRSPSPRWAGVRVRETLSRLLDGLPVVPDNDANYGAVGELHYGAGRDVADLIYVSIGPGIGGGFVVGGQLRRGHSGYAGEVGHMPVNPAGMRCRCGSVGCWETEIGERALLVRAGLSPTGGRRGVDRVLAAAALKEPLALEALTTSGRWLGIGLGGLINVLNPRLVVLGGLFGRIYPFMSNEVERAMRAHALSSALEGLRIVPAALAADAPLLGAAEHAIQPLLDDPAAWLGPNARAVQLASA